ncbi:hypothetical protein COMA1_11222 [Candidatus Nitrospira nitrosa]|uniref:Integrase catalytic domain-containing protein n=1 Tax=Candidatus Nitrospira nitrosa TaxID=1742972 RepID=A0A0S4L9V8_9BACT|nr:IS30 family transposase [Candidatus Nitrospira nitrosa]CUS33561.1 hypothetical protein COMA1_11222 [Candidatus Nitrospira nitrosa]
MSKRSCSAAGRPNRLLTVCGLTIPTPLRCGSAIKRSIHGWQLITAREDLGRGTSATIVGVGNATGVGRVSLAERPAIAQRRGRLGDWEGDLVVGRGQRGFVATHVDRRSRFLLAAKVSRRTATEVTVATRKLLHPLPAHVRRTLTVDNGSEWASFRCLQRTLGLQVYFAAPYAAWERGTNENTNGLLRDYFPKQTDFSTITAHRLASVVEELNNRPRKCLAYRTPAEVFARAAGVALQP